MPSIIKQSLLLLALPGALVACIDAEDADGTLTSTGDDAAESGDGIDVGGTGAAAYCYPPSTPPALDLPLWVLADDEVRTYVASDYGSAQCASFTVGAQNVETMTAIALGLPSDPDECNSHALVVRKYLKGSSWTLAGTETKHGVWVHGNRCDLSITYTPSTTSSARIYVQHSSTTCSGLLCGTSYGEPIRITASAYNEGPS